MRKTKTPARDFAAEFAAQKCITKKDALKLRPGSIIEVKFKDAANARAIVTQRPEGSRGLDVSVRVLYEDCAFTRAVYHSEIVRVHPINVFSLLTDTL